MKRSFVVALSVAGTALLTFLFWFGSGSANVSGFTGISLVRLPSSFLTTGTCSGKGRARHCELRNVCWSARDGVIVVGDYEPEAVLLGGTEGPDHDLFFSAQQWTREQMLWAWAKRPFVYHRNTTAFVTHALWGFHVTHWLSNTVLGLVSMFTPYDGRRVLLMERDPRAAQQENIDFFLTKPFGNSVGLLGGVFAQPDSPDASTHCFPRAVIGIKDITPYYPPHSTPVPPATQAILREHVLRAHLAQAPSSLDLLPTVVQTAPSDARPVPAACLIPQGPFEVLIVQRMGARKFVGLERLEAAVAGLGLTSRVVDMAAVPLEEQVRLFCRAPIVVGAHGNALGHSLWMHPNATLIEFFTLDYLSPFNHYFATLAGVNYLSVTCMTPECVLPEEYARGEDFGARRERSLVVTDTILTEFRARLQEAFVFTEGNLAATAHETAVETR